MSGLVKGVKKVFKAIGTAVKKILKSPIFKAILIGAAAIFTGGAAMAAFGAMGTAGATFGSVMSAGLAGGLAPFQAALGALGIGGGAAGAGAGAGAAGGAASAVGEGLAIAGTGAAEGGAMAAAAAEAAAPGMAAWAAPAADTAALFGGEAAAGMAAPFESGFVGTEAVSGAQGAGSWNLSNAVPQVAQTTVPATSGASYTPFEPGFQGTGAVSGSAGTGSGGNWMTNLWDFVKPETAQSRLLWGQTIAGLGNGMLQGRAAADQRAWQERMSQVPDMRGSFELKPGHPWALAGGK